MLACPEPSVDDFVLVDHQCRNNYNNHTGLVQASQKYKLHCWSLTVGWGVRKEGMLDRKFLIIVKSPQKQVPRTVLCDRYMLYETVSQHPLQLLGLWLN